LRRNNLRIVYNNINDLKINEFMKYQSKQERSKKKEGHLTDAKDTQKNTGILLLLRCWDANVLYLAETQVVWEN